MTPTEEEYAALVTRAKSLLRQIESGEIVSFVAVCATSKGGVRSIAMCRPKWARKALKVVLADLPSISAHPSPSSRH